MAFFPGLRPLISNLLSAQRQRLLLWAPLPVMAGIEGYFAPFAEPPAWLGAALLVAAGVLLALGWRYGGRAATVALLLAALGFTATQGRAYVVRTPTLSHTLHYRQVEATIAEIDPFEKDAKLVLSQPVIEGVAPEDTPRKLRIRFRHNDSTWRAGDRLRFFAMLYPLPTPPMPGGYDFARYFYFRGIGGDGFAMKDPEILGRAETSGAATWLADLRHRIGEDMRAHMPGAAGTVAAAMTVGENGPIPDDVKNTLRDAGLAHMLAIAGLHLGIVAGIVFFTVRLLLTLYPPLALRLPVKKIAASVALMSALIYLLLAGCPIPAQRAFIMVSVLFCAVLLDRRAVTLRTLALAATIILLLFPESLFGASFQLSFAATLAIVAFYEHFGPRLYAPRDSWWRTLTHHITGIALTSLVATLATAPFILYHFNRFAVFGLISNMIVIPLATFLIMPGMLLSLLLLPLGLQFIGYVPLQFGTHIMLKVAAWVVNLPYASLHLPSPSDAGVVAAALGLMWLCLWQGRLRLAGIGAIAAGLATIVLAVPYDLLVSDDGTKVAMRRGEDFVFLRGRPTSFDAQVWLRYHARDEGVTLNDLEPASDAECDKTRCLITAYGRRIAVQRHKDKTQGLCAGNPDIVIAGDRLEDSDCGAVPIRIDHRFLYHYGATGIRFVGAGAQVETAMPDYGRRLWNYHPHSALYRTQNGVINNP